MSTEKGAYEEKTISTQPIFSGKIISLQVDTILLPDGRKATREIVKHPGAVAVIALHEDKLIVVEQYRKPLERSLIEIPAGKIDPGEDPELTAKRELEEETGYRCQQVKKLHSFYTSPGFANEILHLYVAEGLEKGTAAPDQDEFLQCREITFEEALQCVQDGRIADAKTIAAVYAWKLYRLTGRWE